LLPFPIVIAKSWLRRSIRDPRLLIGFLNNSFLQGRIVSPALNHQPGWAGALIFGCPTPSKLPSPRLKSSSYPFAVGHLTGPAGAAVDKLFSFVLPPSSHTQPILKHLLMVAIQYSSIILINTQYRCGYTRAHAVHVML
jgi:hypothetical protein